MADSQTLYPVIFQLGASPRRRSERRRPCLAARGRQTICSGVREKLAKMLAVNDIQGDSIPHLHSYFIHSAFSLALLMWDFCGVTLLYESNCIPTTTTTTTGLLLMSADRRPTRQQLKRVTILHHNSEASCLFSNYITSHSSLYITQYHL